jgi:hypothetical protein
MPFETRKPICCDKVVEKSFHKPLSLLLIKICVYGRIIGRQNNYFITIQAFLEGKTIRGKTIKAFRTIVLPIMILPWFLGFQ